MRYLLDTEQSYELSARQQYLYDVSKLYYLPGPPEGSFIPMIPFGSAGPDIVFITGHYDRVRDFLRQWINRIPEKTLVITSCFGFSFTQFAQMKNVYVPRAMILCSVRKGSLYGFDFDISDAELDFYNTQGSIEDRIRSAYKLIY